MPAGMGMKTQHLRALASCIRGEGLAAKLCSCATATRAAMCLQDRACKCIRGARGQEMRSCYDGRRLRARRAPKLFSESRGVT